MLISRYFSNRDFSFAIKFISVVFLFLAIVKGQNLSQKFERFGQPFIQYYSPKEYKADYANWCVLQGANGFIYVGNNKGLLEYDGNSWRVIKTPRNSIVRSLSMDNNGRIYVTASSDFGYLEPDSIGQLKFVSLLNYMKNDDLEFGDVWDVVTSSHGVYFKTDDKVFRWSGDSIFVYNFRQICLYSTTKISVYRNFIAK